MPTASSTLWARTRPPLRTFSTRASTIKKGYGPSGGRSFHSATNGSSCLQRSDTVDFEKLVPQSSSVMRRTLRVETPLITISCVLRPIPTARYERFRPPVTIHPDQALRSKPTTDSEAIRPPGEGEGDPLRGPVHDPGGAHA